MSTHIDNEKMTARCDNLGAKWGTLPPYFKLLVVVQGIAPRWSLGGFRKTQFQPAQTCG